MLNLSYEITHLTTSQLNVVAFVKGKDSISPERPSPWTEIVPQQEVMDGYPGWGDDAKIILRHLKQPSRWSIHTLYPPLKTFANGNIVLIGDAVSNVGQAFKQGSDLFRHMQCSHTLAQVRGKVLKMFTPCADY